MRIYLVFYTGILNGHGAIQRSIGILRGFIFTYRSIVDERNVHHSLKDAILDPLRLIELLHLFEEDGVKFLGFDAAGRLVEVGLVPFLSRSEECELRYCRIRHVRSFQTEWGF